MPAFVEQVELGGNGWRGKNEKDGDCRGCHCGEYRGEEPHGHSAAAARRSPHQGEADEAEARPGQCVQTETKIDCLRTANRHEPCRRGQGEGEVAARRHVEGMQYEDGDEEHDQRLFDVRNAVHRARHRWKNHTETAMAPAATTSFDPCRRVRPCRVGETHTERSQPDSAQCRDPRDLTHRCRRRNRHDDGTETGDPQRDRVFGRTRPVGVADRFDRSHFDRAVRELSGCARGTARAKRRPAPRRSATRATTGPDDSTVARWTGAPRSSNCTTVPRARSATRSASPGSEGSVDRDRDRLGRGAFDLAHHQLAGMCRRPPVHPTSTVTGPIGTSTSGLTDVGLEPIENCAGFFLVIPEREGPGPTPAGCDVEHRRQREHDPAGPPLQGERCRRGDVERHGLMDPPTRREK